MTAIRLTIAVVALSAAVACPAGARTIYAVMGAGLEPCVAWTQARQQGQAEIPEQWLLGYLSGIGSESVNGSDPLSRADAETVFAWVDRYCQAYPSDTIERAGAGFTRERRP